MKIYLVEYNNKKISQEAYKTLEEAQNFIEKRFKQGQGTVLDIIQPTIYQMNDKDGKLHTYKILEVMVED